MSDMNREALPGAACLLCVALATLPVQAQPVPAQTQDPVVITGSAVQRAAADAPYAISVIDADTLRSSGPLINLSEAMARVPGLVVANRNNYAQDLQISARGFGARSGFGVRGLRLYSDGIPASMPDGQGQVSHFDLASAERVEVLRGPFSVLYGNSSGGVIALFSAPVREGRVEGAADVGSFGLHQLRGSVATPLGGGFDLRASAAAMEVEGFRPHSAAQKHSGGVRLGYEGSSDRVLVSLNAFEQPADDPLGLTRAQFEADPRSVDPAANNFNTRKTVDQLQGGLVYERRINANHSLRALVYSGKRETRQFQAIPTGPQNNPLHPGGVISLDRNYSGTDLRWTVKGVLGEVPASLVAGLAYDKLAEHRVGYQNFVGTTLGVQGARRRDENNDVSNFDQYLQAALQLTPAFSLNAGLRHSKVKFASNDHYIVGTNPDDSGSTSFTATLPVVGVLIALSPEWRLYATAGRGFETPTLNELAYRPGGATGLNFALQAARSNSIEAGVKARVADLGEFTAAVFETRTSGEIVTQSNTGGRATFRNAGATHRTGLELGGSARVAGDLRAQAAVTWLNARYSEGFGAVPAGNKIPGIAARSVFAGLTWAPAQGLRGGVEARHLSKVYVNDANSDAASGYFIASAHIGYGMRLGAWELSSFARVDNLFDRQTIGSVIVNEGNSRFFEPAPGRTWTAGISGAYSF